MAAQHGSKPSLDSQLSGRLPTLATLDNIARPFDPNQPGAIQLKRLARRIRTEFSPVDVEIRQSVWLLDENRILCPGDRTTLTARQAEHLVKRGSAIRA
jgi:hypothetical protein